MTLDELLAQVNAGISVTPPAPVVNLYSRSFWVVVVNPRRRPRKPKFVASFGTKAEADAEKARREAMEAERLADVRELDPEHEPYTFHVIDRPAGGKL